jgi:hypothetical protein
MLTKHRGQTLQLVRKHVQVPQVDRKFNGHNIIH